MDAMTRSRHQSTHRRGCTGWLVSVCLLSFLLSPSAFAQDRPQLLYLRAVDGTGAPVLDLTRAEVIVQQGNAACEIVTVQAETRGMKVALLVGNGANAESNPLRDGLNAFLDTLPPEHEVGVFTIVGQVVMRMDFTADRAQLKDDVSNLFVSRIMGTKMMEGLVETWRRRFDQDDAWPVFVLVLHDGPDVSPDVLDGQFNPLLTELVLRGATVHAVVVSPIGVGQQTALSLNATERTGGTHTPISAPTALADNLSDLAETMTRHYSTFQNSHRVVFECPADAAGGETGVGVTRPGVTFTASGDRRVP